jgi:hypothetical protein
LTQPSTTVNEFAPVTVVHECFLLGAPCLDSAALDWIPAGAGLQPLAYQLGFFAVVYQQQQGFLPVAICSSGAKPVPPLLRLEQIYYLHLQCAVESDTSSLSLLPSGTSVQVLGRDHAWLLVQCRDGRLGFITDGDTSTIPRVGCFAALAGYLLGVGWLTANSIGLGLLALSIFGDIPSWVIFIQAIFLVASPILLLICSRSEFAMVFSIGALTLGLIAGAISVTFVSL